MQTSYDFAMTPAFTGMLADSTCHTIDSARNEELVKIPFGIGLIRGTTDADVKLPAATTAIVAGISVHTHAVDQRGFTGANDAIDTKGTVNVLKRGRCRVLVEQPVVSTDPVFVRVMANGVGKLQSGAFRKDSDGGTAIRVQGIRFISSGTISSPPMAEIDSGLIASLTAGPSGGDLVDVSFDHAATSDGDISAAKIYKTRADRSFMVDAVRYVNPTGFSGDASNHIILQLKTDSAVLASWDTSTGQQGAITAGVFVDFVLNATSTNLTLPPNTILTFLGLHGGTATMAGGRVVLQGHYV